MTSVRRSALALLVIATVLAPLAGCAINPVTGRREISLVGDAQLERIGREGHPAILAEYGLYPDPRIQAYVDSIGHRLASVSHLPNAEWHFTVLDDPVVNAFAVPGGYIYITRGILAHLESEAQLAGVLGHEIGHITARHTASRISQQELAGIGLGVASLFSETVRQYSQAAQTALGLVFLKYGRDDENQADALGVEYATRAGWDPREIPATYAMLKRVSQRAGQSMPTFLSTHPDPGDRETRTTELARAAAAGKSGLVIAGRSYLERLDHMTYGRDPRDGYFEGTHYYHPRMAFQLSFPAGWKTQDTRSSVSAAASGGATVQLALADSVMRPEDYVSELLRTGRVSEARGGRETIGGFAAWVGHVVTRAQDGTPTVLTAGFVRRSDRALFEFVGRSAVPNDADDRAILATIRSFRALTDPTRLAAEPERVAVVPLEHTGTFAQVLPELGASALDAEESSILNGVQTDETVRAGELIKVVRPGKPR